MRYRYEFTIEGLSGLGSTTYTTHSLLEAIEKWTAYSTYSYIYTLSPIKQVKLYH